MTLTYSHNYWKLVADGYTKIGKAVPRDVLDALVASQAQLAQTAAEWMVVDDAGREMARIVWAESGNKPWRKNIYGASIQAFNIFANGPSAPGVVDPALNYLAVKKTLDGLWAQEQATRKRTERFNELTEWMTKHGFGNHNYPKEVEAQFCREQGWTWTPMMKVGSGTKVHLMPGEIPDDCLVKVTSTYLAVVKGKIYVPSQEWIDRDITRGGTRAVYGWWTK